jgi:hypothetical protein
VSPLRSTVRPREPERAPVVRRSAARRRRRSRYRPETATGKPVKLDGRTTLNLRGESFTYATLHEALEDFAWVVLDVYHGGFENNEGGYGSITFDVRKGAVTLDHNDRIIEVRSGSTISDSAMSGISA